MPTHSSSSCSASTVRDASSSSDASQAESSQAESSQAPPPPSDPPDPEEGEDASGEPALSYYAPIHAWDASDQPREKLIQYGAHVLSDAELLALLLGSGTRSNGRSVSAVELGRTLLRAYGSLHQLSQRALKELTRTRGVGPAKATKMMAAFEVGRRVESQQEASERVQVSSPQDVAAVYAPLMRDLKREIFKVVHLNTANVIIRDYTVSEGGLAASIVEPRAVFEQAILDNAASVVCLHNHPSGNPEPSREDIRITRQLVEAGNLMGIPVYDHIIIAGSTHTSLAERGIISS